MASSEEEDVSGEEYMDAAEYPASFSGTQDLTFQL